MSKAIFLEGDLKRHLFNLALPGIISLIVNFSFSLADTFFVSLLGQNELAAMSYTFPIFEFITGVALGLGIAIAACVGQSLGRKEFKTARRFGTAGLIGMFLLGLFFTVVGLLTINPLFGLLKANAQVMPYIHQFMDIWYWSMVPFLLFFAFSFTSRAYGYAKMIMVVGVFSALVNLALDPVLIFGLLGAPKLGVAGAAWASLITRIVTMLVAIWLMFRKDLICACWSMSTYSDLWGRLLKIGIPSTVTNMLPAISVTFCTYLLSVISQEAVAAYGIATKIQWMAVIPMLSASGALSSIVAQNYGAQKYGRAIHALNISMAFAIGWGVIVAIVLALFANPFIDVFRQNDYVDHIARMFLYIVPISFTGWGVIMMIGSTFNAMGKPLLTSLINALRLIVVFMPLAIFATKHYGSDGLFVSLCTSNILVAMIAWWIVKRAFRNCQGDRN